ncbi:hypothetical protein C8T65DRAFT_629775 [Cerioporus squamosus]|nr:hypothetical protein C8T65DRAFT_629775 [Cerioporus squamosus]
MRWSSTQDRPMVNASTEFLLRSNSTSTGADNMSPGPGLYVLPDTMMDSPGDKIPEPPHRLARSYVEHINAEDANDWVAVKIFIKDTMPTILDIKLRWGEQETSRKRGLLSTVLSSYPAFTKYESGWPVLYYCYQTLGQLRFKSGEGSKKRLAKSTTTRSICARRNIRRSPSVLSIASTVTVGRNTPPPAVTTAATTSDAVSPRYVQMMRGEEEVTNFLQSINSTLGSSRLLDRFVSAGVNSGARVKDMANWSATDRDLFLRCEVRLNAFECKLVGDALQRMVSIATQE